MKKQKNISYSQFSQWIECPFRWKLNYIDKLRVKSESIHSLFGTSMHETIQEFLRVMYTISLREAQDLDVESILQERMKTNFVKAQTENKVMDIVLDDMKEFYYDGCDILKWFKSHVGEYFTRQGFELVGIEVPIDYPIQDGVKLTGYLDIVIKDTVLNKIKIFDIKTSTMGWNKYQKAGKKKLMQLVIYKKFYAAQFNINPEDVSVEFIILKRKLYEHSDFPQKRIQRITPASGTVTINETLRSLKDFVTACFDTSGKFRTDVGYEKRPSAKICKYCEYADRPDLCDKNKGIKRKRKTS